jgi:hypothetical protein
MTKQLVVGLFTEGSTDIRFLESVVERTFSESLFQCSGSFELSVFPIRISKSGLNFVEQVLEASKSGIESYGIILLCVHSDSDSQDNTNALMKIENTKQALEKQNDSYCKLIVKLIPIQMTEAWMLADSKLLKFEIGTDKSDNELGINRNPERISDPKSVIKEAIRISRQEITKRRRRELSISELYLPLGQKISLQLLENLQSFRDFKESIFDALFQLNYLPSRN